jgi:uncharacterized protein YeaO (DUF488 family)
VRCGSTHGSSASGAGASLDRVEVRLKRAYDPPAQDDGYRVLIDRVWPRGRTKAQVAADEWRRDLAPSAELRRWFGHRPERFEEFRRRYVEELRPRAEALEELRKRAEAGRLTLVFGARDEPHSNARVLEEILRRGFPEG